MKECTKCNELKDEEDFFFKNKEKGKRHSQCKLCYKSSRANKDYYEKNKSSIKEKSRERNSIVREDNRKKMIEFLKDKKCCICGFNKIVALEFHHRNPKDKFKEVSTLVHSGYSWNTIMLEVEKCDIVCANCHKEITAEQEKSYRFGM